MCGGIRIGYVSVSEIFIMFPLRFLRLYECIICSMFFKHSENFIVKFVIKYIDQI